MEDCRECTISNASFIAWIRTLDRTHPQVSGPWALGADARRTGLGEAQGVEIQSATSFDLHFQEVRMVVMSSFSCGLRWHSFEHDIIYQTTPRTLQTERTKP